jgi:pimeloyl-ACP methyl ester carboxylesterase
MKPTTQPLHFALFGPIRIVPFNQPYKTMTPELQIVNVPHLGGSSIGYRLGKPYDPSRPTLVLINSFMTSSLLYRPQFADEQLGQEVNLLALEPYGHGATHAACEHFTYWDSAIANLQVLEQLGIDKVFVLGTSQGGWIAARMAILAPHRVQGLIPMGTSMDYESEASRQRGCWAAGEFITPMIDVLADPVGADWCAPDPFCDSVLAAGLGSSVSTQERSFWHATIKENYRGDSGRRRLRVCAINLRDRDGLHARLDSITCPVLWLHGDQDGLYSVTNARDGIKRFTRSPVAELTVIEGGQHFLSASSPERVNVETLAFIRSARS